MANAPQGTPVPGAATPGKFPQWGMNGQFQIAEAKTAADKTRLLAKGYMVWFGSDGAAKSYASAQSGPLSGNLPSPLTGIAGAAQALFHAVTDGTMWRSLGWILLGVLLLVLGTALWLRKSAARAVTGLAFPEVA